MELRSKERLSHLKLRVFIGVKRFEEERTQRTEKILLVMCSQAADESEEIL